MSLIYNNATDIKVTREQLDYLPEPQSMGRFHKPYPFAEYVDDIHRALKGHNVGIMGEEYVIQKDQQRLFGMMIVESEAKDWQLTLGVRGSHDQSIPRGIALGTNVMVCSNLCFSGELFTGKAKQTINNQGRILNLIDEAVESIAPAYSTQEQQFDLLRSVEITDEEANNLITQAFRRGALSGAQVGEAIKEYDRPSYVEHGHYTNTWKLFNAFTQAIKPNGAGVDMNRIVRKTTIISKLMNEVLYL